MSRQAVSNIFELVHNDGHLGLNIIVLQRNMRYLMKNFYSFRTAHSKIIRASGQEQNEQQTIMLEEVENEYVTALRILQQRVETLRAALRNPTTFARDLEHNNSAENGDQDADFNDTGSCHSSQFESAWGSEHNEQQQQRGSFVPQLQEQLQNQLQPIVVQLQGVGKIENTWGEFDGDLSKWKSFHDRFKIAVHENHTIAKVFKFQHLCSSLKGYAATAINNWEQTEENYEEAWARLKELYNRPYETKNELFDKFESLYKLDKPSGGLLQKMSNVTHEVVRQLRALGISVDHLDSYFVNGLRKKLDRDTCKQWELLRNSLPNAQNPKLADMLSFIETQAMAMFAVSGAMIKDNRKRANNEKEHSISKKPRPSDGASGSAERTGDYKPPPCVICKGAHPLYKCEAFIKLKLTERKKIVSEKKLCRNCFNSSHFEKDCKRNVCFRCNVKHNSLLCSENPRNQEQIVTVVGASTFQKKKGKSNFQSKEKPKEEKREEHK